MNIFDYLGVAKSAARSASKCMMHVKHYDEVPTSKKPDVPGVYCVQVKKDGIFCAVVKKDRDCKLFSRTGKELTNTGRLIDQINMFGDSLPDGVYMTELCCDYCSLETLSGIFNPNRKKPLSVNQYNHKTRAYLAFHDYLSINDFIKGESMVDYLKRYRYLESVMPKQLTLLSISLVNLDQISYEASRFIALFEEGIVIKRADCRWIAGHKGYRAMKVVRGVSYDLECIGWEEGTGKYKGKVANLLFRWKGGKTIKAMLGKGWTHDDAEWLYKCASLGESISGVPYSEGSPIGKVFKVTALQESSKGVLRLPKVRELRVDKEVADV
jgi:ATP-dependent DNA ligase